MIHLVPISLLYPSLMIVCFDYILSVLNVVLPKFSMSHSYDSVMLDILEVDGHLEVSSAYRVAQKERGT